jgi:hypothetical protein
MWPVAACKFMAKSLVRFKNPVAAKAFQFALLSRRLLTLTITVPAAPAGLPKDKSLN